ncbi:MAG TPA: hypothetical protein VFN36_06815 [Solirubrobacteraceae bacterium]|nr:hypothetical protein [Solirubrobacteraceae bacterium]
MTRQPAVRLLSAVVGLAVLLPGTAQAVGKRPRPQGRVNPAVQLQAVSCPSTGNCAAIGSYADGLGNSQGLLLAESGGRWRRGVQARPPAGAGTQAFRLADGGGLVGLSCPVARQCVAVGRYTDAHRVDHGLALPEVHGVWRRGVRLRLPANALPAPRARAGAVNLLGLGGVSCSSAGNCVAVGNYETTAEVWQALIVVERGGRWSRGIEAPLPTDAAVAGQNAVLLTVTCGPGRECAAAGEYVNRSGHQQSLLVSGRGGRWAAAPAPAAPSDANSDPNIIPSAIACASPGDCAAVGTYINPLQNSLGLLLSESAGQWSGGAGAILPPDAAPAGTVGDQTVVLSGVACPQPGGCTAVGWYFDNDENGQGLLIAQRDGIWQPGARVTLPTNAVGGLEKQSAGLDWISCPSYGNCLATGVYTDIGYNSQGLLLSEVGGVWQSGVEAPLPRNASMVQYASVNQAACTAAGDCTVIGQYDDRAGRALGFVLAERGGIWGRAAEVRLPAVTAGEARLSLRAILNPGTHRGELAKLRASGHFDYTYQAVEAGTASTRWYAGEAGAQVLIAAGRVHVRSPGRVPLRLALTERGRSRLARAHRVHVTVVAAFTPRGRHRRRLTARSSFTLS